MDTEDTPVDNRAQWKVIECLIKILPAIWIAILFVYFVQESIHHGYVSTFVVSSEQVNSVRVFDFETKKECDGLYWIVSSVNEVSDHDKLVVRYSSSLFEHLLNVVKLTVDVACNFHRAIHWYNVWLLCKDTSYHVAKLSYGWLCDRFAGPCLFKPLIDAHLSYFYKKY